MLGTPVSSSDSQASEGGDRAKLDAEISRAIQEEIGEACSSGGTIRSEGVFLQDLNGDGLDDLIVSHAGIECGNRYALSYLCGVQVCAGQIYLNDTSTLRRAGSFEGNVEGISSSTPPIISIYQHGGRILRIQWDGRKFAGR